MGDRTSKCMCKTGELYPEHAGPGLKGAEHAGPGLKDAC